MRVIEIAVVIVSYKSAKLAVECLASIETERSSAENLAIRVVLVDNASGDLPEIQRAVEQKGWGSWVTLLLAPKNGGFGYGNNLGIQKAFEVTNPDYIYALNPDTLVRQRGIAILVEFLERHPEIGVAGSSFETEDGEEWPFAFRYPSVFSEIDDAAQFGVISRLVSRWTVAKPMTPVEQPADWICGASMMIRREVLSKVGCFDENYFLYFEETELCHRARRAGFPTWYVPQSRVMHVIGGSTSADKNPRLRKRKPGYWFESRSRYYATTHSLATAVLVDIATIFAGFINLTKSKLLRRPVTPYFIRDVWTHSVLFPKNRSLPPLKSYFPPA